MIAKHFLRATLLATALTLGGAVVIGAPTVVHAAEKKVLSREVGLPFQDAVKLLKQRNYKGALAKLDEASKAKANKSAFETYNIENLRAGIYSALHQEGEFAKALGATLATGEVPASEALKRRYMIAVAYYETKQYAKFSSTAEEYYKAGGTDPKFKELAVQIYLNKKDYRNAIKAAEAILKTQGAHPSKAMLQTVANAQFNLGSKVEFVTAMEQLLAHYPDAQSWDAAIKGVQKLPGFNSNRLQLDIRRLELATGQMKDASQYMELAQLAMSEGLGIEAQSVMAAGFKAGVLGKNGAEREKRLADMAGRQVGDDKRKLPEDEKEAMAQPDGKLLVRVGAQYTALGEYPKAIELIQAGMKKDQLKYPDEAKLRLMRAYLLSGDKRKAVATARSIKGTDGTADIARLYLIQAGVNPF